MKLSNQKVIETVLGKYFRVLETSKHIYFLNFEESDDNAQVKMFDRERNLISDNYFATEAFMKALSTAMYWWVAPKLVQHLDHKKIKKVTKKFGDEKRIAYICIT